MYTWLFKKIGWKFFAVGAATAFVGAKYVRPAMVTLVKTGLDVSDAAVETWSQAKTETSKIVAEAADLRKQPATSDSSAELRKLRAELAAVKAAKKAPSKVAKKTATKRAPAKTVAA